MKFADNIIRNQFDETFIKTSEKEFKQRDEYFSLLWEIEKANIAFDKDMYSKVHLYKIPLRAVKIGENIYNKKGHFITYRSQ